jgi:hypothetical protein
LFGPIPGLHWASLGFVCLKHVAWGCGGSKCVAGGPKHVAGGPDTWLKVEIHGWGARNTVHVVEGSECVLADHNKLLEGRDVWLRVESRDCHG